MADGEQPVNGSSRDSSEKNGSQHSDGDQDDDQVQEMSGWLMKRTKMSRKWKKQWFRLKNTDLHYGDSAESTPKRISLMSAEISESNIDHKDNAFRIKPKDSKRVYYVHADDENTQHNWMQAICFAKAAGKHGDASQACVLQ